MTKQKKTRAEESLKRILYAYKNSWSPEKSDPFKVLVRTVLSQNTNWRNEETAYRQLSEMIGITPERLAEASTKNIANAIKPAGMYNQRSRTLKLISQEVIKQYAGDLAAIVSKPYAEARESLMSLSGVGEKTADVVLLFNAGKEVLPVDRHITRIAKRLEIVSYNAKYDDIRLALEKSVDPQSYLNAHIGLIQFGRETCKALNPKCNLCILKDLCPYPKKGTRINPQQSEWAINRIKKEK